MPMAQVTLAHTILGIGAMELPLRPQMSQPVMGFM